MENEIDWIHIASSENNAQSKKILWVWLTGATRHYFTVCMDEENDRENEKYDVC